MALTYAKGDRFRSIRQFDGAYGKIIPKGTVFKIVSVTKNGNTFCRTDTRSGIFQIGRQLFTPQNFEKVT